MRRFARQIIRHVGRVRSRLSLETIALSIPPFTASFKLKRRRKKTTIITKVVQSAPIQEFSPSLSIFWDTVDSMTDSERRRAMKKRDWETAIVASLIQSYIRAQRVNKSGG